MIKLSDIIKRNTKQDLVLENNSTPKLSDYVKSKEIVVLPQTTETTKIYNMVNNTPPRTGNLSYIISPNEIIQVGAQWRKKGDTIWRDSGYTYKNLPAGNHEIEFKPLTGYTTPSNKIVTIDRLDDIIEHHSYGDPNYFGDGSDGDLFTTGNVSFPSTVDGPTVYKNFNNLTINSGHTVTTSNRCKGLVIYCLGDCTINGTLSMTARGCRGVGEHFKPNNLDKLFTIDGALDRSIGVTGGAGGAAKNYEGSGHSGSSGINGACGGGGSGSRHCGNCYGVAGSGSSGTTYSGGSGGGALCRRDSNSNSGSAETNGGAGGWGSAYQTAQWGKSAGGGAGNNGGSGSIFGGCSPWANSGENGTGGLLILIVKGNLIINGNIQSKGSNGGNVKSSFHYEDCWGCGGGASGGGSITILYKQNYSNIGSIQVNGGSGGIGNINGGAGGIGSLRINKIL